MTTTSRIEIDLAAIAHNIQTIRRIINPPGSSPSHARVLFCAVIKQDAYALGAPRLARVLTSLGGGGADMLAVYCAAEARQLADLPIKTPILVLMPTHRLDRADPLYRLAVAGRLHMTLHGETQALDLASAATRLGINLPVHVQVDTGLTRGGCLPDEAARLLELVANAPRLRLAGLMTHFSSPATDAAFTREQARVFRTLVEQARPALAQAARRAGSPCILHAANSAAAFRSASLHGSMVRIGQAMYGYGAEVLEGESGGGGSGGGVEFTDAAKSLRPAVRWLSRIVHVHDVPADWPVGYHRTFTTRRPSRIAIVPVGYADGYPVALSNHAAVRLTGGDWDRPRTLEPHARHSHGSHQPAASDQVFAPVVGRVSMDQITIDVTDAPEHCARVGAEVEVVSTDPAAPSHLPTLAAAAGTITHEMLCRLSPALDRTYLPLSPADDAASLPAKPEIHVVRTTGVGSTAA